MASAVYQILSPSGKRYVGSAVDYRKRWRDHRYELTRGTHHSAKLQRAWNKYGEARMQFSVIQYVLIRDELVSAEQYWMNRYDCYRSGYNMTPVAGSSLGRKVSDQTKQRLREINLQPERRAAHSALHKGKIVSAETRELQAAAKRGRKHSEATKAKMRASHLARLGKV